MALDRENGLLHRAGDSQFATTQWSIVLAAGHPSSPDGFRALESLCKTYWYPLYAYAQRQVNDSNDAQDLTQSFFAELLDKNYIGPATADRGRFRAYLLTCFKHFLSHQWEKAKAQKRGGGRPTISLSFDAEERHNPPETCTHMTADQLFERQWVIALLERVMGRLQEELSRAGKAEQFRLLKGNLVGESERQSYADLAAQLKTTAATAKMATTRMRRRYRQLLRDEIAQTVSTPDQVDQEIRDLFATLAK